MGDRAMMETNSGKHVKTHCTPACLAHATALGIAAFFGVAGCTADLAIELVHDASAPGEVSKWWRSELKRWWGTELQM